MTFLKKAWPEIVLAAGALWTVFGTQIQAVISAHPAVSAVIGVLVAVGTHLLPSPVAPATK
jgi:hypothetical protein